MFTIEIRILEREIRKLMIIINGIQEVIRLQY
jgi:hypothetical protein